MVEEVGIEDEHESRGDHLNRYLTFDASFHASVRLVNLVLTSTGYFCLRYASCLRSIVVFFISRQRRSAHAPAIWLEP